MSWKGRFRKDIRESFRGGPTATEARLALLIRTGREASEQFSLTRMAAPPSRGPKTLAPLKTLCPRPSHRLAKLKTALMMLGVLRGWPRRTLTPPTLKTGSAAGVPRSVGLPGARPVKL